MYLQRMFIELHLQRVKVKLIGVKNSKQSVWLLIFRNNSGSRIPQTFVQRIAFGVIWYLAFGRVKFSHQFTNLTIESLFVCINNRTDDVLIFPSRALHNPQQNCEMHLHVDHLHSEHNHNPCIGAWCFSVVLTIIIRTVFNPARNSRFENNKSYHIFCCAVLFICLCLCVPFF